MLITTNRKSLWNTYTQKESVHKIEMQTEAEQQDKQTQDTAESKVPIDKV